MATGAPASSVWEKSPDRSSAVGIVETWLKGLRLRFPCHVKKNWLRSHPPIFGIRSGPPNCMEKLFCAYEGLAAFCPLSEYGLASSTLLRAVSETDPVYCG